MTKVFPGRYVARAPGEATALFLIGMRLNSLRGMTKAGPVLTGMPKMLKHLSAHPEFGLLGFHSWFGRTTILLSYWRTAADVQRFASDPTAPHAAAWREYTKKIGDSGDVGIWHELYTIRPGDYEGIYGNMPEFGLALAGEHLPIADGTRTSKQRMVAGGPG